MVLDEIDWCVAGIIWRSGKDLAARKSWSGRRLVMAAAF
jgi:hypothetical protein